MMEAILAQQRNDAKPIAGRTFLRGVLGVMLRMALVQGLCSLVAMLTGAALLGLVPVLYALLAIARFVGGLCAGSLYRLREGTLCLQRRLGDCTVSEVKIPLQNIVSIREAAHGEDLHVSYRRVRMTDAAAATPFRMRIAFMLALFSARLARLAAGKISGMPRGYVVVYAQEGRRRACVFLPNEAMRDALRSALPDAFGAEDRTRENTPVTLRAQALERAFPDLYAHVTPLVDSARIAWAKEEIARQEKEKAERTAKKRVPKQPQKPAQQEEGAKARRRRPGASRTNEGANDR